MIVVVIILNSQGWWYTTHLLSQRLSSSVKRIRSSRHPQPCGADKACLVNLRPSPKQINKKALWLLLVLLSCQMFAMYSGWAPLPNSKKGSREEQSISVGVGGTGKVEGVPEEMTLSCLLNGECHPLGHRDRNMQTAFVPYRH